MVQPCGTFCGLPFAPVTAMRWTAISAEALRYWTEGEKTAYLAVRSDQAVGSYYIRPNQPGGGAHVCNCGFVTHPQARGQRVARNMLEHALKTAKAAGYSAMQFNFVLASNAAPGVRRRCSLLSLVLEDDLEANNTEEA